ncbi:PH domain-containing protein [Nocardia fusca]|uniref:PH domain-containing protein n=1 Tax=Nocardia fusca TaxID=941183 RepID=UPI0037C92314
MIRTTRLSFLGVFILAMCVFFPIVGWPAGLFWLALIPLAVLVWIVRTQTKVSPAGLDLRSVFSSRHIDWAQVKGLSIPKRGFVRAHLDDDSEVPLPAVSYDRLRDLVDASGGRIPDPFAVPGPAPAEAGASATTPDEATPGADDAMPDTEAGSPAPADTAPGDTPPSGPGDVASGDAESGDTTSDDAAPGDATSDRPAAGGSGKARDGSGDSSRAPGAADTGPGHTSERE